MTEINKQKFLAELGKLLTFMYDEDRQTALEMYDRMFDCADNEQTLLQFLVSPTRQAVIIARAYNARERKLQVDTQSREDEYYEQEGTPDFVLAIEALEEDAFDRKIIAPEIPADQFSLFSDGVHPTQDSPDGSAAAELAEQAVATPPQGAELEAQAVELEDDEELDLVQAESAQAYTDLSDEEAQQIAPDDTDEVDAFLSEFSIAEELPGEAGADEAEASEAEAVVPEREKPAVRERAERKPPAAPVDGAPRRRTEPTVGQAVDITEKKAIVPLLVLYVIAAIPVGAMCVLLLLIPTFCFLALAAGAVSLGCMALSSAFGAFTVFADVMVVLGAALIVLSLGLLFLWIFVWFVGGAIAGLINALIKLGGKWCFKEVTA